MVNIKIVSPIPPSVNNYLNYKVERKNKKVFVRAYKSEASLIYEGQLLSIIEKSIEQQGWVMPDSSRYIIVEATFFWPRHGMDCNNHWKLPLDVFKTGKVYYDDSKVREKVIRSYVDANNPRIEFKIYESQTVGIFESQRDLEIFKFKNCDNCSKNADRCAILKRALENRLTDDINVDYDSCNKIKPRKK